MEKNMPTQIKEVNTESESEFSDLDDESASDNEYAQKQSIFRKQKNYRPASKVIDYDDIVL